MTNERPTRGSNAWLVNVSEVERIGGWSLRSALVRYAQAQPVRAGAVLEVVRRIDAALAPHRSQLERATSTTIVPDQITQVLAVARQLDALADTMATWADDRQALERPDALVDTCVADVTDALDRLGVAREVRDPAEWAKARRQPSGSA